MSDAFNKFRARVDELKTQLDRGTARPTVGARVAVFQKTARPLGVAAQPGSSPEKLPDATGREPLLTARAPVVLPAKGSSLSVTLTRRQLERDAKKLGPKERGPEQRPRCRGDCVDGPRPCPHVGCRYHLALDVSAKTGSLHLIRPETPVEEMTASCALDVADDGPHTLEQVAGVFNVTRERGRQLETSAILNAEKAFAADEVRTFRGSCKAVSAYSGRTCRLPAHGSTAHHDGRTAFTKMAEPEQVHFDGEDRIQRAALAQNDEGLFHAR